METQQPSLRSFLEAHEAVSQVEAFVADINGVARGKILPRDKALTLEAKGLAMPRSVYALDIWGNDVAEAGLAFGTGDPDSLCFPVAGRHALVARGDGSTAQVMLHMAADGDPCEADPRGVLQAMVARLAARGLRAVVATELEFYLHRIDGAGRPVPPDADAREDRRDVNDTLSLDSLIEQEALFADIRRDCAALGIPADALLSEAGPGQFELNVIHRMDPVVAADDAILLKRVVKAAAGRHGMSATFMAKPYGTSSGSGMHIHVSLLDEQGTNILAQPDGAPSDTLFHAVAGLLEAMPASMLALAPHANSYRRFRANAHAPITAGWGMDDRSAAVRVVVADARSTRIEHRVSGADCNPYLAVAVVLAGMLAGIDKRQSPPPVQDRAHPEAGQPLPTEWGAAIEAFQRSPFIEQALGGRFRDIYVACKRQDRDTILSRVSDVEYSSYLKAL